MTGNDVRRRFLEYFKKRNHQTVRSSSLVPQDDPTLLFTNAGMVQFKRVFLGEEKRDYARAVTSQKCVRAGGKHNDLEKVGYTTKHHTFFEMLGNFSFGDYFKEKAIEFAWDLLVSEYGLPADRLYVSVYLDDDEAYDLWHRSIGIPEDRIVRLGEKDNFWAMGDTGPCGPCSEILIDRGKKFGCERPDCTVGCECDRYLEIWNLVFMQFSRDASGRTTPLPKPSIDTGLGLERIVSIVQNVPSNYDIDLIMPITAKVESLSEKRLGDSLQTDIAIKVIADHSRAAAFLIGDGILPSNEGRGYVLRRIIRRAIRYGRNIDLVKPFLHKTSDVVSDIMKPSYPELSAAAAFITNIIKNEEIRFSETLDSGLKLLSDTLSDIKAKGQKEVPGHLIFKLYDTYGFPVDIVMDVVRDERMTLDMEGFDKAMEGQRAKSRAAATFSMDSDACKNLSAKGIGSEFAGYDKVSCTSKIILLVKDGDEVKEAGCDQQVEIVTETTPFYGEAGGQVGDTGRITGQNVDMVVSDTIRSSTDIIIHKCRIVSGSVKKGETVTLAVDRIKRDATACSHTATHTLHSVLRNVLGDHIRQAGSLVAPDRLRFDFTHSSQVDTETLNRIESIVNEWIRKNIPVQIEEVDAEKAFRSGATALFEEKYGDMIRVVSIATFSKELCGGTHTGHTGNIGLFKIIGESSVASGVRRIEALTGGAALTYIQKTAKILQDTARLVKERPEAVVQRIEKVLAYQRSIEKEVEKLRIAIAARSAVEAGDDFKVVNGIKVLAKKVAVNRPAALRNLADRFKEKIESGIVVLGSVVDSKALLVALVTNDLAGRFHAGSIIEKVAAVVGGSGGGRPTMAQAGGTMPEKLDQALEEVYKIVLENQKESHA